MDVTAIGAVTRYFRAIDDFNLDELMDCFAAEAEYAHPLLKAPARGRDELRRFFEARGRQEVRHVVTQYGAVTDGGPEPTYFAECLVQGTVEGVLSRPQGWGSFVVLFQVDGDGRIARYTPYLPPEGARPMHDVALRAIQP